MIVAAPCPPPVVAPSVPPGPSESDRRDDALGQLPWAPLMEDDLCEMSQEEVRTVEAHFSAANKKYMQCQTWSYSSAELSAFTKRELLHWIPLWAAKRRAADKPSAMGTLRESDLKYLSEDQLCRVAACHVAACWAEERAVIFGPVSQPPSPVAIVNADSSPVPSQTPPATEPSPPSADDCPSEPLGEEGQKASPPYEVENDRQTCAATEFRQVSATSPPEECSSSNVPMPPGTPASH